MITPAKKEKKKTNRAFYRGRGGGEKRASYFSTVRKRRGKEEGRQLGCGGNGKRILILRLTENASALNGAERGRNPICALPVKGGRGKESLRATGGGGKIFCTFSGSGERENVSFFRKERGKGINIFSPTLKKEKEGARFALQEKREERAFSRGGGGGGVTRGEGGPRLG